MALSPGAQGLRIEGMESISVMLPDEKMAELKAAAQKLGLTPEELLQASLEEKLQALDADFQNATAHVLRKNAELYKRLA